MGQFIEILRQDRDILLQIASRYHAENVRLFGSVARGEDHADSDIDFLVDFKPGATLFDQIGLIDALSGRLGHKVDVVSSRGLNPHLSQRILQEAVKL